MTTLLAMTVVFSIALASLAALSAGWSLFTPVLVSLATRLDGYAGPISGAPIPMGANDSLGEATSRV